MFKQCLTGFVASPVAVTMAVNMLWMNERSATKPTAVWFDYRVYQIKCYEAFCAMNIGFRSI
jgi:hypothetical protein